MGKQFLSPEFCAPNVREVAIPTDPLAPAMAAARQIQQRDISARDLVLEAGGTELSLTYGDVPEWHSDIKWWSAADSQTFAFFRSLFDALGIADKARDCIDFDQAIRMYAGYFVTRSTCTQEDFHVDWVDCDNDGLTINIPLTDNLREMGLVYRDFWGNRRTYRYPSGKGLIFGDRFLHSTEQGETSETAVALCFIFGTDKMERWKYLETAAGRQARLFCRPDGVMIRDGVPLESV